MEFDGLGGLEGWSGEDVEVLTRGGGGSGGGRLELGAGGEGNGVRFVCGWCFEGEEGPLRYTVVRGLGGRGHVCEVCEGAGD